MPVLRKPRPTHTAKSGEDFAQTPRAVALRQIVRPQKSQSLLNDSLKNLHQQVASAKAGNRYSVTFLEQPDRDPLALIRHSPRKTSQIQQLLEQPPLHFYSKRTGKQLSCQPIPAFNDPAHSTLPLKSLKRLDKLNKRVEALWHKLDPTEFPKEPRKLVRPRVQKPHQGISAAQFVCNEQIEKLNQVLTRLNWGRESSLERRKRHQQPRRSFLTSEDLLLHSRLKKLEAQRLAFADTTKRLELGRLELDYMGALKILLQHGTVLTPEVLAEVRAVLETDGVSLNAAVVRAAEDLAWL